MAVAAWTLTGCGAAPALPPAPIGRQTQVEITEPGDLLTPDGRLARAGWSRRELLRFDPARVAAPRPRLRRWDFLTVMDRNAAVNLTVVDLGFAAVATVEWLDFAGGRRVAGFALRDDPGDRFELSKSVHGDTWFYDAGATEPIVAMTARGTERNVRFRFRASAFSGEVHGALTVTEPAGYEYLALATPFSGDPYEFFYEQKIPGLIAAGEICSNDTCHRFVENQAFAGIDWGRGVWPKSVFWRWSQVAGGTGHGRAAAFNLGNGFGDMSAASENLFIDAGRAEKLAEVNWSYTTNHPGDPWTFASAGGRVRLQLTPRFVDQGGVDLVDLGATIVKVYGTVDGSVQRDDGGTAAIAGALGFAEEVHIRWN